MREPWRVEKGGQAWELTKGETAREQMCGLVGQQVAHAVLAFAGAEPVGWCSFGPYESFPRLRRSRSLQRPRPDRVWSVVCFYILPRWRGRAVATRLLSAAARRAFDLGAAEVEGYPVNTRPGVPLPGAFAWTGVKKMFGQAGFARYEREGAARDIYVLLRR